MDSSTIFTFIGGFGILAMVIIAIYLKKKNSPSATDKDAAKEFLEGLSDTFYNKMLNIINNFNFSNSSLEEVEAAIIGEIYSSLWQFVEAEMKVAAQKDILTAMALKVLNQNYVDNFLDNLIDQYKINEKIENNWIEFFKKSSDEMEAEDAKLQNEFSDKSLYNEDFDSKDLAKAEVNNIDDIPEEAKAMLNPAREEDEGFNPEDESMEILEDSGLEAGEEAPATEPVIEEDGSLVIDATAPTEDDTYVDNNGRRRSKTTGRYV